MLALVIIKPIYDLGLPPKTTLGYILMIIGSIVSLIMGAFINYVPYILISKIPILISKLNMYLFKISIGYKK